MNRTLYIYAAPPAGRYALVRGDLRVWLQRNAIHATYSNVHRGWHVRTERVPDLTALAERDGFRVHSAAHDAASSRRRSTRTTQTGGAA